MLNRYSVEIQDRVSGKVLYIHDNNTGGTLLRICKLPKDLEDKFTDITCNMKNNTAIVVSGKNTI